LSSWEYYSKDKHAFGLKYQVICSLGKPFRILSVCGPFKGSAADVSIFRSTIPPMLTKDERVLGDRGYWQETEHILCPPVGNITSLTTEEKIERRSVTRVRHLIERVFARLKQWTVLTKKWHLGWRFHEDCFFVCAGLTNLCIHFQHLT
jgi:hypothetical protein